MGKKKYNQLYVFVFFIAIISLGAITIITKDIEISVTEKRTLVTFNDVMKSSFFNGDFQEKLESAYADQFVGRYKMIEFKKRVDYFFLETAYANAEDIAVLKPLSTSGVDQIGDTNYMIDHPIPYSEISVERAKDKTEQINQLAQRNPDTDVYLYLPINPNETSIFDETNDLVCGGPAIIEAIEDTVEVPFDKLNVASLDDVFELFYSSDHHLNHRGSYQMYKNIMTLLGKEDEILEPVATDHHVGQTYYGTYSSRTGYLLSPDYFSVDLFDLPPYTLKVNGNSMPILSTRNDFKNVMNTNERAYYYDIAYNTYEPLAEYDFNQEEKENILLVGDSISRSFVDVLGASFNKTYRLVPYVYTQQTGNYFDYDTFIEENDIDIVIFCYGLVNYYYQDEWGDRYLETTIPGGHQ